MAITVALLLIAFICTHHTSQLLVSSTYCPATERQALAELKTGTIDPAGRLSSWSSTDCCQWDGVRCDNQTGHVVGVDLRNLHVYLDFMSGDVVGNSSWALEFGLLSPSLLSLNHLLHLDLSGNYFQFPAIPQFLGSFQELRYLNLSLTNLKGTIPHQLGNLSTLHTLSLLVNFPVDYGLYSLALDDPRWISGLTSLQHLEIGHVSLGRGMIQALNMLSSLRQIRVSESIVDAGDSQSLPLVNFTSLEVLDLWDNWGLTSAILSWLPNLTHLQHLDLSANFIQGFLPTATWNVSSLEHIDMSINLFTGTIPEIAGNLEYLDLHDNLISGAIPASIGNLTQLRELYLGGNNLKGQIPESIGKLHRLLSLGLSSNTLSGPIPVSITILTSLEHLALNGNSFYGSIPRSLWRLSLLQELDLSDNNLTGTIPQSLGQLSNLVRLDLSDNRLTGTIPQSLGQLSNLVQLDLSDNRLTGTIPQSLGQLSNLVRLDLSNNSLVGVVTESHIASLAKLRVLSMSHNSMLDLKIISGWRPPFNLSGLGLAGCRVGPQFPGWLRFQRDITYLDLSNAIISDSLPDWFWSKLSGPKFSYLLLSNNNLTGTVPTSVCEVRFQVLDLSGNHLTGQLPNCSIDVTFLDVSNNSLSGDIPEAFLNSTGTVSLHLSSNSFTGEVPTILKQGKYTLSILDLGNNRFRGIVPVWLDESFTSLRILRLRSNMLIGSLPTETLSRIPNLQILDLSHNNLSGVIPKSFGNLTAMMRQNEQWYHTLDALIPVNEQEFEFDYPVAYTDKVSLDIKGRDLEYSNSLQFLAAIDLSDNNLSGAIPEELGNLSWLQSLNVSGNCLTGEITAIIGGMQRLESLDLSRNEFSGPLPQSLANLNSLGYLNVSYNNFSSRIPSGGHIDTFFDDPSVYMGNPYLNNVSLAENNHENQTDRGENEEDDNNRDEIFWLYAGLTPGFAVGLCILYGALAFKETWRRAYFQTVDSVCDFLYVMAVIHLRKLKRIARVHD